MFATRRPGLLAAALLALAALAAPARGDDKATLLAALERGRTSSQDGKYGEAAANYEKAYALAPTVFGPNSINMAGIRALLADCYQQMGDYARAESFYQQALTGSEARPGGRHDPLTAEVLMNLASLYRELGQYAKAEPLYQRSLAVWEAKLGKDHPDVAASLNN
ncbi:MAG TPA: tetratricopeptide repeat protein, partial [Gemmataceae bacterium]|nr:tetratricopeptide repeat protein [Gemmataceae bacterium]